MEIDQQPNSINAFTFAVSGKRHAVLMMISIEHDMKNIADMLKVAESFVCNVKHELMNQIMTLNLCLSEKKKHSKWFNPKQDEEFIDKLQNMVGNNSGQSMGALAM
ncbi:unnamed protein product [Lepeophtheirus salmonis]|uniref:(salmon louse) hypothetical protein n=1 Tax=Lepeophtheirus salmonis TaxID=72036 RepID=A0A7R8CEF2_LEPSM|nr:unnamed protein product [Lepeophtheirus salmonis]CAF2794926.1 unnamed protein product [Lepeophtheirus salmonis]